MPRIDYFDLVRNLNRSFSRTEPDEKSYPKESLPSKKHIMGSKHSAAFLIDLQVRNPSDEASLLNSLYIYRELLRRNKKAAWVRLNPQRNEWPTKINPVYVGKPGTSILKKIYNLFRIIAFCKSAGISLVFLDDWLLMRNHPSRRLAFGIMLKLSRLKLISIERDPYVDYEIASKRLRQGSWRFRFLSLEYRLYYGLCDLVILPSEAYARHFVRNKISRKRPLGAFRGIDTDLFFPSIDARRLKVRLGLSGKFIVGWFGNMNAYRRINEILIPMIKKLRTSNPEYHFLVGGKGRMEAELSKVSIENHENVTLVGFIPYEELPEYVACCDVLLSPLNSEYDFTQHTVSLKVVEALAVGRPVVATRTKIAESDFKDLQGVYWADDNLKSFLGALEEIKENYSYYATLASAQSRDIIGYSERHCSSRIVDTIEEIS